MNTPKNTHDWDDAASYNPARFDDDDADDARDELDYERSKVTRDEAAAEMERWRR